MVGIIILNYKTYEKTLDCIRSIRENTQVPYRIYLIDNDSGNGSMDVFRERYGSDSDVCLMDAGENLGYAKGNNLGLRRAEADGCDAAVITNNDILFQKDAIDILYQTWNRSPEYLVFGPWTWKEDGSTVQPTAKKRRPGTWRYFLTETYIRNLVPAFIKEEPFREEGLQPAYWICGCCFLVDVKRFKAMGYFDTYTFLYFEEFILSEKARQAGGQLAFQPAAKVIHYHGASVEGGAMNIRVRLENFRSELYFVRTYWHWGFVKCFVLWCIRNLEVAFNFRKSQDKSGLKEYRKESRRIFGMIGKG